MSDCEETWNTKDFLFIEIITILLYVWISGRSLSCNLFTLIWWRHFYFQTLITNCRVRNPIFMNNKNHQRWFRKNNDQDRTEEFYNYLIILKWSNENFGCFQLFLCAFCATPKCNMNNGLHYNFKKVRLLSSGRR